MTGHYFPGSWCATAGTIGVLPCLPGASPPGFLISRKPATFKSSCCLYMLFAMCRTLIVSMPVAFNPRNTREFLVRHTEYELWQLPAIRPRGPAVYWLCDIVLKSFWASGCRSIRSRCKTQKSCAKETSLPGGIIMIISTVCTPQRVCKPSRSLVLVSFLDAAIEPAGLLSLSSLSLAQILTHHRAP